MTVSGNSVMEVMGMLSTLKKDSVTLSFSEFYGNTFHFTGQHKNQMGEYFISVGYGGDSGKVSQISLNVDSVVEVSDVDITDIMLSYIEISYNDYETGEDYVLEFIRPKLREKKF